MRFTYRTGERPLAGYTVKRGVGKGGFGEVYFAVSDSGKEVALKLLRGGSDVEMRGVANCLNLKHPNLVHIYDLKEDSHGDKWLVMEYVLGESMAQVIDRHPNGLPVNLAVEWFQSLARAVAYLHDHGVVHRDLKPANIFLEHGSLKVGDYGLCKAMSLTNKQQTRTVGTVHFMAPEISSGNYTKSIDIYACGVMLHEMLTGKLPFDGESDGEILMKHLTATPDLTGVPEPFKAVILKALDKNPQKRYATMTEMAKAVDAAYPTQPVTPAPPMAKSVHPELIAPPTPAEKPPEAVPVATLLPKAVPVAQPIAPPAPPKSIPLALPISTETPSRGGTFRDRLTDLLGSLLQAPLVVAVGIIPWMAVTRTADWATIGRMGLISLAVTWAMLLASGGARYKKGDTWGRRLRFASLGLVIGLFAFWLEGWIGPSLDSGYDESPTTNSYLFGWVNLPARSVPMVSGYALYFACVFGAARWWRMAARDRKERFSLFPPFVAAFWGLVLSFLWPWHSANVEFALIPLVLGTIAVQWVSPWVAPPPPLPKKLKWRTR
ncbi:serine/threonine protein kinase [Limnoglobus roseus]|uniref:Serine/threonine-protein kinase n=1 Tax=Limnoglobus roseus TaxID=2598579 RepID=A0A5C1A8Z1_9BACT|nr:serine/threonine-protein kinase [Limnoglobus roseus]QEL15170.1 serine/threonine-protein kinase [Limnoglobus roseus]